MKMTLRSQRTNRVRIPIVFTSNDSLVACRSNANQIELRTYELEGNGPTETTYASDGAVTHVALSPDGLYAGCISVARKMTVWDLSTKDVVAQFVVPSNGEVRAWGISSGGNYVAVGYGRRLEMWSREKNEVIWNEALLVVGDIIMPLSADCTKFTTWKYTLDMETGDCRELDSIGVVLALSADGKFVVRRDGSIYSLERDADEPVWEASSASEANKPRLLRVQISRACDDLPEWKCYCSRELPGG